MNAISQHHDVSAVAPDERHTTPPTAVVTGASRGLGAALTSALVQDGWHVIATARTAADLTRIADVLSDGGGTVDLIPGDVTNPEHRRDLADAAGERLDLLVNNASALARPGVGLTHLHEVRLEEMAHVYATNVFAPADLTARLLPALRRTAGVVINISSDAATGSYAGWGVYGSSKAALDQVSNVLAAENPALAVYALDPGDMRTRMHQEAFPDEDISDRPEPGTVVPALLRLIAERPSSGRYTAAELLAGRRLTEDVVG